MNIGTSECVKSKYFTDGMDESLEDFQESKKVQKAPQKPKPKARKAPKRIKGQRDIRKVVNAKKNELEKYSEEFDTICKQSGIDVDSEQLQLAIALSKSLQTGETSETQPTQSTQNRLAKIRTTLQEYGFKVPEAKKTNKKVKKTRKQYRLINITDDERRQNIIDKYSQVLLRNEDFCNIDSDTNLLGSKKPIFDIGTSLPYKYMQDNTIFYTDIIEKSRSNGVLLRDWANISGRPLSPKLEINIMNISDIPCSQDEIDKVLSGSITAAKNIINKKMRHIEPEIVVIDPEEKENAHNVNRKELSTITHKEIITVDIESNDSEKNNRLAVYHPHRSASPDLFDDEPCELETSTPAILTQEQKTKAIENDFMDLTECANGNPSDKAFEKTQCSQFSGKYSQQSSQSSQNVTKRKSNDLMEMTECVMRSQNVNDFKEIDLTQMPDTSENIKNKANTDVDVENDFIFDEIRTSIKSHSNNVDLTQSSNEENIIQDKEHTNDKTKEDCMDLTQSTNSSVDINDLPPIMLSNTSNLDNTVILNEDEYLEANGKVKSNVAGNLAQEVFDLTQLDKPNSSIHSDKDSLKENSFFDEFVHNHSSSDGLDQNDLDNKRNNENVDDIDLTQSSDEGNGPQRQVNVPNNSSLGKKDDISIDYDEIYHDVDESIVKKTSQLSQNRSKEISREIESSKDTTISQHYNDLELPNSSRNSEVFNTDEEIHEPNNFGNLSQNSEVFDISDTELNYSLHKSRLEVPRNIDLGGISVINNVTIGGLSNNLLETSNMNANKTVEDSFLPEVNIKSKVDDILEVNNTLSSDAQNHVENTVKTPKNSEFIVKTSDVTPMLDYATMSTPQRNNELDKYGLKPFKRKRAIQILTHLYNQTHPLVQKYPEDQPSPKKQKQDNEPSYIHSQTHQNEPSNSAKNYEYSEGLNINNDTCLTPKKSEQFKSPKISDQLSKSPKISRPLKSPNLSDQMKSPKISRLMKSPIKSPVKCNKIASKSPRKEYASSYEVSNIVPVIRNLERCSDDWVFQKREKAKIHSCRVPLHVAFHNYVASRSSLMEAILNYEPVNIDVIHKDLVSYGHRYDPKDLLKFLDKKCITVKTTDNNGRNNKR